MPCHKAGRTPEQLADGAAEYLQDVEAKRDPYDLLDEDVNGSGPRSPAGTWVISSYALARVVLQDARFSRAAGCERESAAMFEPGTPREVYRSKTVNREGTDHTRLRKLLHLTFWCRD